MANFRVTYATLSADNEELHAAFEEGVKTAQAWVGQTVPTVVDGEARTDGEAFTLHSPNDAQLELAHRPLGHRARRRRRRRRRPGRLRRPGRPRPGRSGSACCAGPPT